MTYTKGDKVRCTTTIYAGTIPSIPEGSEGVVEKFQPDTPYPVHVLWNAGGVSRRPYLCAVEEYEIELIDSPEKIYSEPVSGG